MQIRDTSVLVKLRPAWEELRSYLTANTRKRFEVYVCTMAERDYALEMWRLLDPEAHLISLKELRDRIVCVKPGQNSSLASFIPVTLVLVRRWAMLPLVVAFLILYISFITVFVLNCYFILCLFSRA